MGVIFAIFWIGLFLWRKNTRKEMLIMSTIFAILGPFVNLVYTIDWWRPHFLLGFSSAGIEDIIMGFAWGGVIAVIYESLFDKKLKIKKVSKIKEMKRTLNFLILFIPSIALFFALFILFDVNSFHSTIVSILTPSMIIWIKRKDLVLGSLFTGILSVLIAMFVYTILEILTPGWVQAFWLFENVPNIVIFNLPIDDIVWYFVAGLFVGPLYKYWKEAKVVNN